MCGRYTLRRQELESVKRELHIDTSGGSYLWEPRYNIAPTQQVPILVRQENGERSMVPMVWGIPRSRNGRMVRQINARSENSRSVTPVAPLLRTASRVGGREDLSTSAVFFHRPNDGLILMAGLWHWHHDAEGYGQTFVIVTTAANSTAAPIHDRMPAIVEGSARAVAQSQDHRKGFTGSARPGTG